MKQMNRWGLVFILLVIMTAVVWAQYRTDDPLEQFYAMQREMTLKSAFFHAVQNLIAALLGGLCGFFCSQQMKAVRSSFFRILFIILAILGTYYSVVLGDIILFTFSFVMAWNAFRDEIAALAKQKPTTFGSAEWATLKHLQENNLVGEKGLRLGFYQDWRAPQPVHYTGVRHLLTVAPTRSGKGVSSIIPNLLTYEGSVLVIDPKGENAKITAGRRGAGISEKNIQGLGQNVHVVDPWKITGLPVSRFNPMDWLNPEDEDINENAMMLADSIVTPHAGARGDEFWDEEAKALLMGFLIYVATVEAEKGNRTLGRVRELICLSKEEFNGVLVEMVSHPNHIVSSTAARTLAKEEKLLSSVLASLQSHTHFLDSPRIRESLSVSDFRFEDIKTKPMTIYLVLPADRLQPFGRWLRLLIQQAITVNARNIEIKPEKPVLFILDEMAALGRLTMVEQAFSLMAGFGMQLWGIVQDLSQLERIYDKGWETFIGNSGVIQYFGSRDHKTAEYFSKLCGVTTVEKFSFTRSIARAIGFSSSGGPQGTTSTSSDTTTFSNSTTEDVAQRHLAYPDELMVLRDNKELIIIENFNPIPGKKMIWYSDEKLKPLGISLQ